jgi:hypothetical protein
LEKKNHRRILLGSSLYLDMHQKLIVLNGEHKRGPQAKLEHHLVATVPHKNPDEATIGKPYLIVATVPQKIQKLNHKKALLDMEGYSLERFFTLQSRVFFI